MIAYYCIVKVTCARCCAWGEDKDRTVSDFVMLDLLLAVSLPNSYNM